VSARDGVKDIIARVGKTVIGQDRLVERLVFTLLANGNVLLEGLPGLAKTRAVKGLGKALDAKLSRIQFTPDLLPADITGSDIYDNSDGKGTFRFREGPIFANLVLADEINRAPAKVQSALLEAMEERQVTVAGTTHKMPELFAVMATQNPIEQEGTYPLPEAQMDRFLMHVKVQYPDPKSELAVIDLVRGEELPAETSSGKSTTPAQAPVAQQVIFDARKEVHAIFVAPPVAQYIVDIVNATRFAEKYDKKLKSYIQVGASPRGALGLDRCARVNAWLQGRDHVTPDDVRAVAHDVLRHRLMLSYEATAQGLGPDQVIDEVLKLVAVA
jgi:MoxR-like ATPase